MVRRFFPFAAVVLGVGGCSLFTSLEGLSGGGGDGGSPISPDAASVAEAGSTDATTSTDASSTSDADEDAGSDAGPAPPNVHPNGTFDTTLDPWAAFQGTASKDTTARTGPFSLRACGKAGFGYFTADDGSAFEGPVLGATYRAEAWVRTAPGAAVPPVIKIFLRSASFTPDFTSVESTEADGPALTSTWQKLSVTLKLTKPAQRLGIYVGADYVPEACFLLDDVALQRVE
ncbi:MAG: hypothetical protein JST00_37690 [Deltaproteobacteria bacterium]|nr:hypothetical protein [Deltaproteobacteria bacterium]